MIDKYKIKIVITLLIFFTLVTTHTHADILEARNAYKEFRSALAKAQDLDSQGHSEQAEKQRNDSLALLAKTRALFEAANALVSSDYDVLIEYAEVLNWSGDSDLAAEALNRATELKPSDSRAWLALGRILTDLGPAKRNDARKALEKAISVADSLDVETEARLVLAVFYWDLGLYNECRAQCSLIRERKPDHISCRIVMTALDTREGLLKEASDELDSIGNLNIGQTLLLNKVLPKALDDFELSRKTIPDEAEYHVAYAKLLIRANRAPLSIYPLERAVRLKPDEYRYWNLLASVAGFTEDHQRARQAYEKSLELYPDQPRVRKSLQSMLDGQAAESISGE